MRDLRRRSRESEQMDDPALPTVTYDAVLADLGRINTWTLAAGPTLSFVARATRGRSRFSLLDIGFGDGGMLRRIATWAKRAGKSAELVGIDLNPKSEAAARAATARGMEIDFRTGDYRGTGRFDLVVSSLVAHHMRDDELHDFLRWMETEATRGWLINDLHRHAFAYHGYPLLARLLRVHPIVREDGQLSIARAFRPREWRDILDTAGVREARVLRYFPFRLCVERLR